MFSGDSEHFGFKLGFRKDILKGPLTCIVKSKLQMFSSRAEKLTFSSPIATAGLEESEFFRVTLTRDNFLRIAKSTERFSKKI